MYPTFTDTQRCTLNDKVILAQVVVEWKRKQQNIYPQIIKIGSAAPSGVYIKQKNMKNVDNSKKERSSVWKIKSIKFIPHR